MTKRRYRAGRHWLWNAQMFATKKVKVVRPEKAAELVLANLFALA